MLSRHGGARYLSGDNRNGRRAYIQQLALLAESNGKRYYGYWIIIDMPMNQQFINSMLGVNRITVIRALKELREKNLIMQINNKYYCIRKDDKNYTK